MKKQGGLDCRHLISHIQPNEYRPLSLTSLSVPHRGSPFMDWCLVSRDTHVTIFTNCLQANIGIGSPRPFPFPPNKANVGHSLNATTTMHSESSHAHHNHHHAHHRHRQIPFSLSSPLFTRRPESSAQEKAGFALSMLPTSFTSLMLSLIDSPAYANLTTSFLRDVFNPSTPDKPGMCTYHVTNISH